MSGRTRQRSGTDISELVERAVAYDPDADPALLRRAYELAEEAHRGQKRLSGDDYVTHPLEVAKILVELEMDDATLAAALLHDVVEDTGRELEEVREKFGEEIASLVDGVTKLRRIQFDSRRERQAENLRRMLLAMAKDLRVILIKL
ncbi:MAG: HD domain-containing protein, partial [Armatimonadetes bacterium]|nr:HD domain-containing protein [Armatimonadota bacterium]